MHEDRKEFGKWWIWVLVLSVLAVVVFTGLNYLGVIGQTVVERKVFEESFQYSEATKAKIATYEAQLAELQAKLRNPNLGEGTRNDIEAQMSAIRIQLATAKRRQ